MRFLALALLLSGCTTARIVLDSDFAQSRKADYEDHLDYYALGFVENNAIDLQRICMERKALAAERTRTFEDGLLTVMTLGIYSPLTVRVWCE